MKPNPEPNPMWEYSPPRESKCGRYVSFDAMVIYNCALHNEVFKVKPAEPERAAWLGRRK